MGSTLFELIVVEKLNTYSPYMTKKHIELIVVTSINSCVYLKKQSRDIPGYQNLAHRVKKVVRLLFVSYKVTVRPVSMATQFSFIQQVAPGRLTR